MNVYKLELLVIAAIFIIVGALLMVFNVDVGARDVMLSEVLIVIGIIFIIIWAILLAIKEIMNR